MRHTSISSRVACECLLRSSNISTVHESWSVEQSAASLRSVMCTHADTGSALVKLAIGEMIKGDCEEVVLEAEVSNSGALALYQNLGFIRDKRLHR